jgi:hypothetical protein
MIMVINAEGTEIDRNAEKFKFKLSALLLDK